jgi:hypothetical protein
MGVLGDVRKNRLPIGYSKGNVEMQFTELKRVDADKEQLSASIVVKRNNTQETVSATLDWDSDEKVFVVDAEGITASVGDSDSLEVTFDLSSLSLEKTMTLSKDSSVELTSGDTTITYLDNTYTYNDEDNLYYYFAKDTSDDDDDDDVADDSETNVEARYVSMLPLSDSIWENYTKDVATYEGLRYEPTDEITSRLFRETLHIISLDSDGSVVGTIRASSIYEDSGDSSTTTVDTVSFPVQSSEGIYNDVKLINISYDNDSYDDRNVRTLRLYY